MEGEERNEGNEKEELDAERKRRIEYIGGEERKGERKEKVG